MIDIIIIICCILGGFAIGKYFEKRIRDKGAFYQDLTRYIALLKDNVNGRQLEMATFNNIFAESCGRCFSEYVTDGKIKLRLSKPQKDNLNAFFVNLNCSSSQALIEHLNFHGKVLSDDAKSVFDNEVSKCSVYPKLGMLLGAMLGIILI